MTGPTPSRRLSDEEAGPDTLQSFVFGISLKKLYAPKGNIKKARHQDAIPSDKGTSYPVSFFRR